MVALSQALQAALGIPDWQTEALWPFSPFLQQWLSADLETAEGGRDLSSLACYLGL